MYLRSVFVLGTILILGIIFGTLFRGSVEAPLSDQESDFVEMYPLVDPEMAPAEIYDQVTRGYNIIKETRLHLPEYAGNKINCTNCHSSGGNSFGGKHNGFSLVGVVHKYPRKLKSGEDYTLAERMNSCFVRSLNGKPVPVDSQDMLALIAYLEWISSGVPKGAGFPWLGMKEIRSGHTPDPVNGAKLFALKCAPCHGEQGQGQERPSSLSYPPLWGENSFNDGAGMHHIKTFAYFVFENMPYEEPTLSYEEALDVAAFVTSRPRPKFVPSKE